MKSLLNYENKFGIIFGDDLLSGIHLWKNIDKLQDMCELICLRRNSKNGIPPGMKIMPFENRLIELSSTEIRLRLGRGLPVKGMVTDSVMGFIQKKGLYGIKNGNL